MKIFVDRVPPGPKKCPFAKEIMAEMFTCTINGNKPCDSNFSIKNGQTCSALIELPNQENN